MFPYHYTFADENQDTNKSKKENKKSRRNRPRTPTTPNEHTGTFPALVEQRPSEPRRSRRRKAQPLSPEIGTTSCSPVNTDQSDVDEYFGIGCVNREANRTPRVKIHHRSNARNKPTKPRRKKKKRASKHEECYFPSSSNPPLYFHDRPASQFGSGFHNRESSPRNVGPRRSAENVYGYSHYGFRSPHEPNAPRAFELPPLNDFRCRMLKKPSKLPPIVRDNQADKKWEDRQWYFFTSFIIHPTLLFCLLSSDKLIPNCKYSIIAEFQHTCVNNFEKRREKRMRPVRS